MSGDRNDRDGFDARAAWNHGARAWDTFVERGDDYYRTEVHSPTLLAACGEVAGLRVLDLGCGQGYFSRRLAQRGARVTGVDLAEGQIANARRHEADQPLGIEYHLRDAARVGEHWPSGSFDLVAACMALHDMPDPLSALRSARTVLVAGGRLIFSIPHPCTDTPFRQWERDELGGKIALKIDRYFASGSRVTRWNMDRLQGPWETPYWHKTLAEWSGLIAEAGFLIRRLHEPRPTQEKVAQNPNLDDCYRLPYFIIFDLVLAPQTPS
ncbi:MAG: class I SAM-dependent methyltransferase [Chloroflexota bacterium]|nr:class I SAM-dependent methyltransferase [Chloroflexota bacterium]